MNLKEINKNLDKGMITLLIVIIPLSILTHFIPIVGYVVVVLLILLFLVTLINLIITTYNLYKLISDLYDQFIKKNEKRG